VVYGTGFRCNAAAHFPRPRSWPAGAFRWRTFRSCARADRRRRRPRFAFAGPDSHPACINSNVVVPEVPDGDRTIVAELRGLLTKPDLMLAVQH